MEKANIHDSIEQEICAAFKSAIQTNLASNNQIGRSIIPGPTRQLVFHQGAFEQLVKKMNHHYDPPKERAIE